ncbi:MAG: peptidoglycan DD-metalloendopeptidase family protein [Kiloniellaceae bacterium]
MSTQTPDIRWRRAVPLALLAAGLLLGGCIAAPTYRPATYVTPKDPPPLPLRKPQPPSDLAAWSAPAIAASSGVAGPGGAEVRDIEVTELTPQNVSQQQAAPAPLQTAAAQQSAVPADGRHVVAAGDSLYGIARRFGLPIRAVIDANDLQPPYALTIGQVLTVPHAQVHEVAAGDTVFNIAQRYDVDRSELVRMNRLEPPYTIPLGQKLLLPTPGSAVQAGPPPGAIASAPREAAIPPEPQAAPAPVPAPTASAVPQQAKPRAAVRAALANPPARAGSSFLWPVQGPVLSSFGTKTGGERNDGINIAAPRGTPVRAAENGVVAYAGEELRGFGKLLLVKHADGWVTAYAHNEELLVAPGDHVQRGQTIARVGSSGHVDRPQLHFEVRRGTRAVNPETELSPRTASAAD